MRGERGFALVITLLVTALLTALLVEFVSDVYVDTAHSHNFVASQQAGMLAASGITGGIKLLEYDLASHNSYTSLLDLWAKPQSYDAGVGTVTITIEEESGKMDLNSATSDTGEKDKDSFHLLTAQRLLRKLELSSDLYDALCDWVDTNDTPKTGGAEIGYYRSAKPAYPAKNGRLETVEELALVKGFTPEVLEKLKPCVTVYPVQASSGATPININTAPKELLYALHDKLMNGDLVDRILEYRKTKAITNLNNVAGLEQISSDLAINVVFKGEFFRIHSEAKVGETVSIAEAVVKVSNGKSWVVYWREY